jgi:hypothetical protein
VWSSLVARTSTETGQADVEHGRDKRRESGSKLASAGGATRDASPGAKLASAGSAGKGEVCPASGRRGVCECGSVPTDAAFPLL